MLSDKRTPDICGRDRILVWLCSVELTVGFPVCNLVWGLGYACGSGRGWGFLAVRVPENIFFRRKLKIADSWGGRDGETWKVIAWYHHQLAIGFLLGPH